MEKAVGTNQKIKRKIKMSVGDRVFGIVNLTIIILIAFTCIFPFINMLAISFSDSAAVMAGSVSLWPKGFQLEAYSKVFENSAMWRSLLFTIFLTVLYTFIALALTTLCAYPLSKKRLKGRNVFLMLITFTMYFSAGTIPTYLLVYNLHLLNTIWALILPCAINTFNMIMMKTFFQGVPESLEESAIIDGCSDFGVLLRITLPVSKPILATLALFYAVQRWNAFSDALYYINVQEMYPLQLKLQQLIAQGQADNMMNDVNAQLNTVVPETIKAASIIFATVPIILVYPWLQKYFVKGVMIGAVKG